MPILALIASTALFWLAYWFIRMGGVDQVSEALSQRRAAARKAEAREIERLAPLQAVDDPRDAAAILMVLVARVDHDPRREHVAAIERAMHDVLGFAHDLTARLTHARFIAGRADRFEEAVALFGDLLNKSLTLDEKWQLVEMVEAIAAVEGPSEGQTEAIKVLKRRIGLSPAC